MKLRRMLLVLIAAIVAGCAPFGSAINDDSIMNTAPPSTRDSTSESAEVLDTIPNASELRELNR